jgi:hypothetical protein
MDEITVTAGEPLGEEAGRAVGVKEADARGVGDVPVEGRGVALGVGLGDCGGFSARTSAGSRG